MVDVLFPALASGIVVVVNQAIVALVGALGVFERHPTLSAMHKSKVLTIFLGVAFNTGVLPLVVSAAPPPRARRPFGPTAQQKSPVQLHCVS